MRNINVNIKKSKTKKKSSCDSDQDFSREFCPLLVILLISILPFYPSVPVDVHGLREAHDLHVRWSHPNM